jgi:hypothetical protein
MRRLEAEWDAGMDYLACFAEFFFRQGGVRLGYTVWGSIGSAEIFAEGTTHTTKWDVRQCSDAELARYDPGRAWPAADGAWRASRARGLSSRKGSPCTTRKLHALAPGARKRPEKSFFFKTHAKHPNLQSR